MAQLTFAQLSDEGNLAKRLRPLVSDSPTLGNLVIPYSETPFSCLTKTSRRLFGNTGKGICYPRVGKLRTCDDYFRFQKDTSETIAQVKDAVAGKYRSELLDENRFPELEEAVLFLNDRRRGTVMMRGVHSRIYALALGGRNDTFLPRIGASIEFLLDDMYYLNQFFDSKSGPDAATNIIAAIQSNDLFWGLLVPPGVNRKRRDRIFAELNEDYNNVISGFYFGEYIDCKKNVWRELKDVSFGGRMDSFTARTYFINTLFFQAIANMARKIVAYQEGIGTLLFDRQFRDLSAYAHYFGMGLQCANDIADFVPPESHVGTSAKQSSDSWSDIRNGKMTLPVIVMLEMADREGKKEVVNCLEKGFESTEEELRRVTDIFLRSGAYNNCRNICRKHKEAAGTYTEEFRRSIHFLLNSSATMLDSNRYFHALVKMKKGMSK